MQQRATAVFLRCLETDHFVEALHALRTWKAEADPVPPPTALWRLGVWLTDRAQLHDAQLPLRLFLDLYPNHQEAHDVMKLLARVLHGLGEEGAAAKYAREAARRWEASRDARREEVERQFLLSGRAHLLRA